MQERSALVTGASSGLCAGLAAALAADGFARVAITFRDTPPDATVAAIEAAGARAAAHRVDFSAPVEELAPALDALVAGDGPYDTLVHGVGPLLVRRFAHIDPHAAAQIVATNLTSALLVSRAVLPAMRERGFGRLIFFGANGSSETRPAPGFTVYGAAKSGVTAFARALALEEARHGITVNVVEPGDIREKRARRVEALAQRARNPRGRAGSYEDVADVVRFLVARERDFVTGAVIAVTGGLFEADERNAPPS